jgi:SAM-dependent methyltransferase
MTAEGASEASGEAIARIARRYDAVPYLSLPYSRLQPARMAAVARLLGLSAPTVETARVLEIGCASGGHIIPLASRFPESRFTGLDVSHVQIGQAEERASRLGLGNVAFGARSFTDLRPEEGPFDYIICHGVYSWISPELRRRLLETCARYLSPAGIALISFNVLPGWRMFQIVRDSMLVHLNDEVAHHPAASMRALVAWLEKCTPAETTYGRIWHEEAPRMFKQSDAYLQHELLEEENCPCTITEFAHEAGRSGLAYLAESWLFASSIGTREARVVDFLQAMAGDSPVAREQYFDIVTGRTFRQSLLIHGNRANEIDRSLTAVRLDGLHFVVPTDLKMTVSSTPDEWTAEDNSGTKVTIADRGTAAALAEMIAEAPASTSFADASAKAREAGGDPERLVQQLVTLVREGILDPSASPVKCARTAGERPKVWQVAASDASAGLESTATLRHAPFEISPKARFLMPLADGTRDKPALVSCLSDFVIGGGVQISENGVPITDRERLQAICADTVNQQLDLYARAGLLVRE